MNKSTIIIAFLAGILVGILAWNIVNINVTPVYADGMSTTNGLIAVTGMINNNTDGLWVLDTRDTDKSPSLCLYIPDGSTRGFKFVGVRRIKYDGQMVSWQDNTDSKYSVDNIKNTIREKEEKQRKEEEEKQKREQLKEQRKNKNRRP